MEGDIDESTRTTDNSVDYDEGMPQVQQVPMAITLEDLYDAFELQNQQLKATWDAEMDKRFPAQGNNAAEVAGILGSEPSTGSGQHVHEAIDIEQLLQQRSELSRECQRLQAKNKNARQKIVDLEAQIDKNADLMAQINAANEKNADLKKRMTALRQMLVPAAENQIIDSQIVQKFTKLRSGIFALVRQTWRPAIRPGVKSQHLSPEQLKLLVGDLTYDRLRSVVFLLIDKDVFSARPFFLGNARAEIDKSLRQVEKYLMENTPEDNESRIMDWRNATFKVTEGLRDAEGDLSQHTRRHIFWFLNALQTTDPLGRDKAMQRMQAICDEAVELSMMMRKAKDYTFVARCEHLVGSPVSDHEEVVEDVSAVKTTEAGHKRGTIAYVVCGALVKKPKDDPKQHIVLEKAEVAVYH